MLTEWATSGIFSLLFLKFLFFSLRQILFISSAFLFSVPLVQEMPKQTDLGKPCLWNGCFWQAGSGQELWLRVTPQLLTPALNNSRLTISGAFGFPLRPCKNKGLFLHFTVERGENLVWMSKFSLEYLCQALRYLVMTPGGGGFSHSFFRIIAGNVLHRDFKA